MHKQLITVSTVGFLAVTGIVSAPQLSAQSAAAAPKKILARTADGHPDLSGMYDVATMTPLQRPAEFGNRRALTKEEAAEMSRKFSMEKIKIARETIEGTACDKTKVVAKADNGEKYESLVWYAPTLKQFPLRIQMNQQQSTVVLQYRDVKLVRPDARQFEAPAGFTRYNSVEELMQTAMMKILGRGKK